MADATSRAKNFSAGVVLYRHAPTGRDDAGNHNAGNHNAGNHDAGVEILLVHPGGPFWAKKDTHGWSIPKGEYDPEIEDAEVAAVREFQEETGHGVPDGQRLALKPFKAGRKTITAWLVEGDLDEGSIESNSFEMEWPPKSGRMQRFPEVDRAAWFSVKEAETKLHKGQLPICRLVSEALTTT